MAATKVSIGRMTTSRTDDTKYEYWVTIHNDKGETITPWMHYKPERSLFEAIDLAAFLGVPYEPLKIDGVVLELDNFDKRMLKYAAVIREEAWSEYRETKTAQT
jgi:hypothetical protein